MMFRGVSSTRRARGFAPAFERAYASLPVRTFAPAPTAPPLAVLVDFDGVVRSFPKLDEVERACGLPLGALLRTALAPVRLGPAITGRYDDAAWRAGVIADLALAHPHADARAAVRAWSAQVGEVDAGVLSLLLACKANALLVLVTNATTRLHDDLAALGLRDAFDAVISSAEVGCAKPDADIFHAALRLAEVRAEEALFIDDRAENVAAARALGITGLSFRSAAELHGALAEVALLPPPRPAH